MFKFGQTTAKIATRNLAGFGGIPNERVERQIEGLALLDVEIVALVEINPLSVLSRFEQRLAQRGVTYQSVVVPQASGLHIGVLFKEGVSVKNPRLLEGSDLGDPGKRKAFVVEMKIGRFDFLLVVVHLKSGRGALEQHIRDEQAKVIGQFLASREQQQREDILLAGDFNMIPGQDVSNFHHLGGEDLMDFVSSWAAGPVFPHPGSRQGQPAGRLCGQPDFQHGVYPGQPAAFSYGLGHGHWPGTVSRNRSRSSALCRQFPD